MLLLQCFSATWKSMLFHSNNPSRLPSICLCYNLLKKMCFLFAAVFKIPQPTNLQTRVTTTLNQMCMCTTPPIHIRMSFLRIMFCFWKLFLLEKGCPSKEVSQMTIWCICCVRDITSLLEMLLSFSLLAINACHETLRSV